MWLYVAVIAGIAVEGQAGVGNHILPIVKQVLEYGYDNDWRLLKSIYGIDEIKDAVMSMRTLEKRALSFVACITHTDIRDFRCYSTKQSSPAPWIF